MNWMSIVTFESQPKDIKLNIPLVADSYEEAEKLLENKLATSLLKVKSKLIYCNEEEPINKSNFEETAEMVNPYITKVLINNKPNLN